MESSANGGRLQLRSSGINFQWTGIRLQVMDYGPSWTNHM